jgi:hypothetical protein
MEAASAWARANGKPKETQESVPMDILLNCNVETLQLLSST